MTLAFTRHYAAKTKRPGALLTAILFTLSLLAPSVYASEPEVIVLSSIDEVIDWLSSEDWWGEQKHGEQLQVPHIVMTKLSKRWQKNSARLPVSQKKEIFYRFILPLVLHANQLIVESRERLDAMELTLKDGGMLSSDDKTWLTSTLRQLRISDPGAGNELNAIEQTRYKLDLIPPGLALGQAAYESGYGTSRFAAEGNALFGQWTFGGEGLVPEQQRKSLGDHRIASYTWLFDSVRAYFINLNSHPAYAEFREIRANLRATGKPLNSYALADGLIAYSERGQAYIDTLKGIIRVNKLDIADDAVFRDEPLRFIIGAEDASHAASIRDQIENLRDSGELDSIIARMRLE